MPVDPASRRALRPAPGHGRASAGPGGAGRGIRRRPASKRPLRHAARQPGGMNSGQTFERVYSSLKAQVVEGRYAPGERLEPAALGEELFASVTPVRDALHRLVGEGLVVSPRADGFHMPMLTGPALRDLYSWNCAVILLALAERSRWRTVEARSEADCSTASALFATIAAISGNDEHRSAVLRLNERLEAVRRAEAVAVEDDAEVPHLAA